MCDQIRKTQFLSQIKECVNNNFCISVEFYIVLCTVFQLCFCPLEIPNFSDKIPSLLSINRFFWQGVKNFLCPGNLPTHDYQQPICLSNKCHHLLQLQSSSRRRKRKRISKDYSPLITSSLFFAAEHLYLSIWWWKSVFAKKRKEKIENNNNSEQNNSSSVIE